MKCWQTLITAATPARLLSPASSAPTFSRGALFPSPAGNTFCLPILPLLTLPLAGVVWWKRSCALALLRSCLSLPGTKPTSISTVPSVPFHSACWTFLLSFRGDLLTALWEEAALSEQAPSEQPRSQHPPQGEGCRRLIWTDPHLEQALGEEEEEDMAPSEQGSPEQAPWEEMAPCEQALLDSLPEFHHTPCGGEEEKEAQRLRLHTPHLSRLQPEWAS